MRHMKFDFATLGTAIEADWPVKIPVPQDGGTVVVQDLTVRFRMVPEDELNLLGDGAAGNKASLRAVVIGFGKGVDEPFTAELFDQMLLKPYVRLALSNAYRDFCLGAPAKN